jgi:trehalose 2-sulfotransferase
MALPDVSKVASVEFDLPRYLGRPEIYVIASQPRCGSHYLAHLLRQSHQAGVPLEYFHTRHWRSWYKRCGQSNPVSAFRLLCQLRTTPNGVFGVKMHWHQLTYAAHLRMEAELKHARFIYITRDDLLGQAISHVIAAQTGVWIKGQPRAGTPTFSIDSILGSMRFILKERSSWERFFVFNDLRPFRVTYEDLTARRDDVMTAVCAFLGQEWAGAPQETQAQRGPLNDQWRARFHEVMRGGHDDDEFWRNEFGLRHRAETETLW